MTTKDRDLIAGTARWLSRSMPVPGLSPKGDAEIAGRTLLEGEGNGAALRGTSIDVLHAACRLVVTETDPPAALRHATRLHVLLRELIWPADQADELGELLSMCSFGAWRAARRLGRAEECSTWLKKFGEDAATSPARLVIDDMMQSDTDELKDAGTFKTGQGLLATCTLLRPWTDTRPEAVRSFIDRLYPYLPSNLAAAHLSADESSYVLGELALLLGACCRLLARRDEAKLWLDRSEIYFLNSVTAVSDLARLQYERLAGLLEQREIASVLQSLPALRDQFVELGMIDAELKCRILQGVALIEVGEHVRAVDLFRQLARDATSAGNELMVAAAYANLAHACGSMGDSSGALAAAAKVIPVAESRNNYLALTKIHWGLAALLRQHGHLSAALEAYRRVREESDSLGLRGDVAALSLAIADLLLDLGESGDAVREISSVLPIIEELDMTSERVAALTLLSESARRKDVDRAALRELYLSFRKPER